MKLHRRRQVAPAQPSKVDAETPVVVRRVRREQLERPAAPRDNKLHGEPKHVAPIRQRFGYETEWDVTSHLSAPERARLSPDEKQMINAVVAELKVSAQKQGLSYLPVFGYLSLRNDNHAELGLERQEQVMPGRHTVEATLEGHQIGVVASTIYRGTPEHPGVVAGLSAGPGITEGTVLKVPMGRGEELLASIFHREYFAEDDLLGEKPQAMYRPVLRDVKTADGTTVKALVFITNPDGAKDINADGTMTPGQLAWFIGGKGGFRHGDRHLGGASFDYWHSAKLVPDPVMREAIVLSKLIPSDETVEWLTANAHTDPRAMKALDVVLELFQGAASIVALKTQQRPEQALERAPVLERPVDVMGEVERYLAFAAA